MRAGTAWAQDSAGRAADAHEAPAEETDPRRDGTRAQRFLLPAAIFQPAGQFGGGERHFLYVRALGRGGRHLAESGPFICA